MDKLISFIESVCKKILSWFSGIDHDKILHAIISTIIVVIVFSLMPRSWEITHRICSAVLCSIALVVLKEAIDERCDLKDLLADFDGVVIGVIIIMLVV